MKSILVAEICTVVISKNLIKRSTALYTNFNNAQKKSYKNIAIKVIRTLSLTSYDVNIVGNQFLFSGFVNAAQRFTTTVSDFALQELSASLY